jgi:hypothetical protein
VIGWEQIEPLQAERGQVRARARLQSLLLRLLLLLLLLPPPFSWVPS